MTDFNTEIRTALENKKYMKVFITDESKNSEVQRLLQSSDYIAKVNITPS